MSIRRLRDNGYGLGQAGEIAQTKALFARVGTDMRTGWRSLNPTASGTCQNC